MVAMSPVRRQPSSVFSGSQVDFNGAQFSRETVDFREAQVSGGTVDFSSANGVVPDGLNPVHGLALPSGLSLSSAWYLAGA
ncbi:hypothetical protein ACFVW1_20935 [Streptomyces olivochromogenes]|uniref:hypothetical protein n=1 Tax=Streptomyces olivochromogenes TaxID=1963 RepID=UPI0036DE50D9